ncbi:hypothetical protein BUALT_Bualt16G0013100 [Buddleja alternifolia]|uniref:Transmembrane protein n=1 Tax=Buddleja alternifolia TaxID=168488 RepID=A0AAV6WHH0_9LAMI|nr:hypothetical protein BUALT_Bualt16G0013100 [Buddleja alternifolia]
MDDRNPSPASSSSSGAAVSNNSRRHRRHTVEEDGGDPVACTGKKCQSCTAGVIADCVALCCCPCAVVNILALAFFKLPLAVARKCIARRRKNSRRRRKMVEEKRKCGVGDVNGISGNVRVEDGISEIVLSCRVGDEEGLNDDFSAEEFWLELYEVGHLGFGRVSFTGFNFHNKGN